MRVDFEKKQIDTVHPLTSRHIAPAPDGHQLLYIERVPYAFPPFETKYGVLNLATGHAAELGVATDAYIKFGSWSPSSTAVALFIDEYGTEWGPEWLDIAKVASGWRSRISIAKFAAFGLLKEVVWRDEHDLLLLFQQPEAMQYRFYLAPAASLTPENLVLLAEFIDPPAVSWRPGDVSIVYVPQP